jgi:para-nitrobenzyl esterase
VQTQRLYGPGLNNRLDATVGSSLGQTVGAEDCLYLNIWSPAAASTQHRPVIVFVHGGSNIAGYTADPLYDGAALAEAANAVVVTVNYRLGIFGFLNLAQLKTGDALDDSGNFALLDIVQALRFVGRNIEAFGGDSANVTLMGQSAGAVNIYALLTSPLLADPQPRLFHRLAALSGGLSTAATLPPGSIPGVLPEATWAQRGRMLLAQALVAGGRARDTEAAMAQIAAGNNAELAAWLRGKSPDELLDIVKGKLAPLGMSASNPIPDGRVLATDPIAAVRQGRYVHVPVLAGNTRDETKLFPSLLALAPRFGGVTGRPLDDAAVFAIAYPYKPQAAPTTRVEDWIAAPYLPATAPVTGFNARSDALNRAWFMAIRDDMLNALASQQPQVWAYRFDWDRSPPPFDTIFGAAHTFDLPFVFGNFGPSLFSNVMFTEANRPGRVALSSVMMRSLGDFARNGHPGDAQLPVQWRPWPGVLVFDADMKGPRIAMSPAP